MRLSVGLFQGAETAGKKLLDLLLNPKRTVEKVFIATATMLPFRAERPRAESYR